MSFFELYLLTRLDGILGLFIGLGIVSVVAIIGHFVYMSDFNDRVEADRVKIKATFKRIRILIACAFLFAALAVLTPTEYDAAKIYGLHWATNNEDVKEIPNDAVRVIREWINEASPKQDTITQGAKP